MEAVEFPVFIIALRDEWISFGNQPDDANTAFGTIDGARKAIKMLSNNGGPPASAYRICEYKFSGEVYEG